MGDNIVLWKVNYGVYICGALIDNKNNSHIYVLDENDRQSKGKFKSALKFSLVVTFFWHFSTELHPMTRYVVYII